MNYPSVLIALPRAVATALLLAGTASAGTYTVKAELWFFDGRDRAATQAVGRYNGARGVNYRIYDYDRPNADDLLAVGITDENGRINRTFTFNQSEGRGDLYIKFFYQNLEWRVVAPKGNSYTLTGPKKMNAAFGTVNMGIHVVPRYTVHEKAMWVFQTVWDGWNYVEFNQGFNMAGSLLVTYPTWPLGYTSKGLSVSKWDASESFEILKHYGHHVRRIAWKSRMGPKHKALSAPNGGPYMHPNWSTREYPYEAFKHGWAFFSAAAILGLVGTDVEYYDIENRSYNTMGQLNPGNVCAFLSDVLDNRFDTHRKGGFDGRDDIRWNYGSMVWLLARMSPQTISRGPSIHDYLDEYRKRWSFPDSQRWKRVLENSWIKGGNLRYVNHIPL